jgi:hypothetical protein
MHEISVQDTIYEGIRYSPRWHAMVLGLERDEEKAHRFPLQYFSRRHRELAGMIMLQLAATFAS